MRAKEFINETTSAGGIATVAGGMGQTLYRNPSIYNTQPKKNKKKKKGNKYANSKQD